MSRKPGDLPRTWFSSSGGVPRWSLAKMASAIQMMHASARPLPQFGGLPMPMFCEVKVSDCR